MYFSSYGLSDARIYVVMMAVGIVPLSERRVILSVAGSTSLFFGRKLLFLTTATPAVYSFCLLDSLVYLLYSCFL